MIDVPLQIPWHKMRFLEQAGILILRCWFEPVIYCWVSRKVANSGLLWAHHPGSELNVRVPARPYRHMQHTLLKNEASCQILWDGKSCGLLSPSCNEMKV